MGKSVLLQADLCLALNPRTTLTLPVPAPSPPLLQACDQRQSQLTMDQFLGFNQRFAKIRSKRLQKAVTAITGGAGDPSELYLADVSAMPDIHAAEGEAAAERGGEGDEEGDEEGQRPRRMPGDEEYVAVVVPMQGAVTATAAAAGKLLPTKVAGKPPTAAREKAQGKRKRASGSQGPSGGRGRGRK